MAGVPAMYHALLEVDDTVAPPDSLASVRLAVSGAAPLADAIGRQGRRHVRTVYSWRRVREKWMEALADAARSTSEAGTPIPRA
jgi:hypothetical protein